MKKNYDDILESKNQWIKIWKKIFKKCPELKKEMLKLNVLDIGAGFGGSYFSLNELSQFKHFSWVDPNFLFFEDDIKKHLKPNKKLKIIKKTGNSKNIQYQQYQIIIKTFNHWVKWSNIIKKTNNKKKLYLITSDMIDESYKSLGFQIVTKFSIEGNNYLLLKNR